MRDNAEGAEWVPAVDAAGTARIISSFLSCTDKRTEEDSEIGTAGYRREKCQFLWGDLEDLEKERIVREISSQGRVAGVSHIFAIDITASFYCADG